MKRIFFVICSPMILLAQSWENQRAFEAAMVQSLADKEMLVSAAFTNKLAQFIRSDADESDRATATLVLATSMMALFEKHWDAALYEQSNVLASNIYTSASLEMNSWQRLYAGLFLAGSHVLDGKTWPAYGILTNALHIIEQTGCTGQENGVLTGMLGAHWEAPDLTLPQTISLYAAISTVELGHTDKARAFVAGLPLRCRTLIEDAINEIPAKNPAEPPPAAETDKKQTTRSEGKVPPGGGEASDSADAATYCKWLVGAIGFAFGIIVMVYAFYKTRTGNAK